MIKPLVKNNLKKIYKKISKEQSVNCKRSKQSERSAADGADKPRLEWGQISEEEMSVVVHFILHEL